MARFMRKRHGASFLAAALTLAGIAGGAQNSERNQNYTIPVSVQTSPPDSFPNLEFSYERGYASKADLPVWISNPAPACKIGGKLTQEKKDKNVDYACLLFHFRGFPRDGTPLRTDALVVLDTRGIYPPINMTDRRLDKKNYIKMAQEGKILLQVYMTQEAFRLMSDSPELDANTYGLFSNHKPIVPQRGSELEELVINGNVLPLLPKLPQTIPFKEVKPYLTSLKSK